MPNGQIHYSLFKLGYFVELPLSIFLLTLNPVFGLSNFLGYSFHRWLDNDADLMGTSSSEGRLVNELKIVGYILYGFSSVYGAIFRRHHRSFFTHFPLVSTCIRLFFFFWWIIPLYYFGIIHYQLWQLHFGIGFTLGLSQADAIHFIADLFYNDHSKNKYKKDKYYNGYK